MARNRKRAKDRRARRPAGGSLTAAPAELDGTPEPLEHAAPDVELAEAQLAVGRPDPYEAPADEPEPEGAGGEEDRVGGPRSLRAPGGNGGGRPGGSGETTAEDEGRPEAQPPAVRVSTGSRLVNFLQGSWRELQRVQWPDRRQVMQATSVVIGFVIVAGAFLGVADFLAGKLVTFVLK